MGGGGERQLIFLTPRKCLELDFKTRLAKNKNGVCSPNAGIYAQLRTDYLQTRASSKRDRREPELHTGNVYEMPV